MRLSTPFLVLSTSALIACSGSAATFGKGDSGTHHADAHVFQIDGSPTDASASDDTGEMSFPDALSADASGDLDAVTDPDATPDMDATALQDALPNGDATTPGDAGMAMPTTVANLITNRITLAGQVVEIQNAVVVATTGGIAGMAGSFYIQDSGASGPGVMVYHSRLDSTAFPAVGDTVTVSGRVTTFNGVFQISGSTAHAVTLVVTITGPGGTVTGGAYAPAGSPIQAASATGYEHTTSNAHPEQVGNAVQFAGPMTALPAPSFINTNSDGGTHPEGFAVGTLWVDDSFVYRDCIVPLDGGLPNLANGIRGVWDRYQDFYAGTSANPAPTAPVLYPLSCSDLNPM